MTGADHFEEILRQAHLVTADLPEEHRAIAVLQYAIGAVIQTAARLYEDHAYAIAQDLVTMCGAMVQQAHEQTLAADPDYQEFQARAVARVAGIPIPEPKIPQEQIGDPQAEFEWAREILALSSSAPERSAWLRIDSRCCFGGSAEACGEPIDGVSIISQGDAISAVSYCDRHGKIMQAAIAQARAAAGEMTAEEIDRLASDGA